MTALTIAARELRSMFLSPLAWVALGVAQVVLTGVLFWNLSEYVARQSAILASPGAGGLTLHVAAWVLVWAGYLFLALIPFVTMRLMSEERRAGTLVLLRSAPVSATEVVIGKYLGACGFIGCLLGLATLVCTALLAGGTLDWGLLASGLLGLALLCGSFAAAGLYLSTLTEQPAVAAVSTFGVLLLLWIIDSARAAQGHVAEVLGYLSLLSHFESLLLGVFDTGDVVYYLLFIATFLALSVRRLESDRLHR